MEKINYSFGLAETMETGIFDPEKLFKSTKIALADKEDLEKGLCFFFCEEAEITFTHDLGECGEPEITIISFKNEFGFKFSDSGNIIARNIFENAKKLLEEDDDFTMYAFEQIADAYVFKGDQIEGHWEYA